MFTYHMLAKCHVGDPESKIVLKFQNCLFVQMINFVGNCKVNVGLSLCNSVFLQ